MKFVIISPHPDDELIGCFTLLRSKKIEKVYYIRSDTKRHVEAQILSRKMGFKLEFITLNDFTKLPDTFTYLVPDFQDHHPLHKIVNSLAKISFTSLGYYTTDMNTSYVRELPSKLQREKKEMLNKFYPSQKSLWKYEHKYFLFEGIIYDLLTSTTSS